MSFYGGPFSPLFTVFDFPRPGCFGRAQIQPQHTTILDLKTATLDDLTKGLHNEAGHVVFN